MAKGNRGGKRSNNGGIKKNTGFSFINQNGKTITMQINSAGVILVNGSPNKSMTLQKYQAMYNDMKQTLYLYNVEVFKRGKHHKNKHYDFYLYSIPISLLNIVKMDIEQHRRNFTVKML